MESRIGDLEAAGYEYVPEHEAELPERRYFRKAEANATHVDEWHGTDGPLKIGEYRIRNPLHELYFDGMTAEESKPTAASTERLAAAPPLPRCARMPSIDTQSLFRPFRTKVYWAHTGQ